MPTIEANTPFIFYSRLHLRELTGLRAHNLRELLEHLRTVPGSCIYHHTHHFLQQHQHLSPEPPNDFAYWVGESLGLSDIAERLAAIDPIHFSSIRAIREKLMATLEQAMAESPGEGDRSAPPGGDFDFLKSVSVVFRTPYEAKTLRTFVEALRHVTISSLYFHIFEARLRLERPTNDFSLWLEESLGENELAAKIARLDPYTHTMERLRGRIEELILSRLQEK